MAERIRYYKQWSVWMYNRTYDDLVEDILDLMHRSYTPHEESQTRRRVAGPFRSKKSAQVECEARKIICEKLGVDVNFKIHLSSIHAPAYGSKPEKYRDYGPPDKIPNISEEKILERVRQISNDIISDYENQNNKE